MKIKKRQKIKFSKRTLPKCVKYSLMIIPPPKKKQSKSAKNKEQQPPHKKKIYLNLCKLFNKLFESAVTSKIIKANQFKVMKLSINYPDRLKNYLKKFECPFSKKLVSFFKVSDSLYTQ